PPRSWPLHARRRTSKSSRRAKPCASRWLRWLSRVPSRSCARKSTPACTPTCSTASRPSSDRATGQTTMAEIATIARPYAEALYKASGQDAAGAAAWLDALAAVAADAQLQQFADSPKVTAQQAFDLIGSVLKQPLPTAGQNFLRTVIDNGRLAALPEIAAQFRALKNAQQGSFDALVYSAFAIEPAALAELSTVLETRSARKLNVQVELQPELIGGIRVVVGDDVSDTSVKAPLEQI